MTWGWTGPLCQEITLESRGGITELLPGRLSIAPGQEMACLQESAHESSGEKLHLPLSFLQG